MEEKKPMRERLEQDIAIVMFLLLISGGFMPAYLRSPYAVPLVMLFLAVMFGPYLIEFIQEKSKPKTDPKLKSKVIVIAGPGKDGQKEITASWSND